MSTIINLIINVGGAMIMGIIFINLILKRNKPATKYGYLGVDDE